MRVPQILKVKDTCVYVTVGLAGGSLGPDFIGMLRRASAYAMGNPNLSAASRLIATTLLELLLSPVPLSIRAFYDAAKSDDAQGGANTLRVLQKVLQALKPEDRKRFTVQPDWAIVCPRCRRHQSLTNAAPQLYFDCHRADYDYTAPWADVCGLPFETLGPAFARAPPRTDRCWNADCNELLRSSLPDGTLDVKEKPRRIRIGTPQEPQYLVVHYACPPAIVGANGAKRVDVAAMKRMRASHRALAETEKNYS